MQPEAMEILRRLIAYDTTSRLSNLELIAFVENYLSELGVESERIYDDSGTKASLIAHIGEGRTGGVVLSGHTDVVPIDDQEWQTPPFTLTEQDGMLFGRGTSDMKSFLAVCLALVPEILEWRLGKPVTLAFSYDEEVGCLAAPAIARHLQTSGARPDLIVIGEPTEGKPVHAHKGIRSFETIVTGLESHSSHPEQGVNAIAYAAELISFLSRMAKECRAGVLNELFDPPYTTVHVGTVQGGTARNIIPRHCRFQWEIRPLPQDDVDALIHRFEKFAAELQGAMRLTFPGASIETRALSKVPGLQPGETTGPHSQLMHHSGCNQLHTAAFSTEAGIFQNHGFSAMVWGPGSIAQAHKPNEFIAISDIETYTEQLREFLRNLA